MSGLGQGMCKVFSYTGAFPLWERALQRFSRLRGHSSSIATRRSMGCSGACLRCTGCAEPECKRTFVYPRQSGGEQETADQLDQLRNKKRFSPPPCAPRRLRSPARFFFCRRLLLTLSSTLSPQRAQRKDVVSPLRACALCRKTDIQRASASSVPGKTNGTQDRELK